MPEHTAFLWAYVEYYHSIKGAYEYLKSAKSSIKSPFGELVIALRYRFNNILTCFIYMTEYSLSRFQIFMIQNIGVYHVIQNIKVFMKQKIFFVTQNMVVTNNIFLFPTRTQ